MKQCNSTIRCEMGLLKIPNEVFFLIRSYLVVFEQLNTWNWLLHVDVTEGRTNWNDFLSVSGKEEWKALRKQFLAVTLGFSATQRFLDDGYFRNYINGLMSDPHHQLSLKGKFNSSSSLAILEMINKLQSLTIVEGELNSLPTLSNINTLYLFSCDRLVDISRVNKLNELKIAHCPELKKISCGIETKLTYLSLDSSVESIDINATNVESLTIPQEMASKTIDFKQFTALKNLTIVGPENRGFRELQMNLSEISSLQSFNCDYSRSSKFPNFLFHQSFDIRKFPHLTTLCVQLCCINQVILGKIDISQFMEQLSCCPNIKRFTFGSYFPKDFLIKSFPNAADIRLHSIRNVEKELILGDKIRIFHLSNSPIENIKGFRDGQRYLEIKIRSCLNLNPLIINQLKNVTRVNLEDCSWLYDITPLADVPYLRLSLCDNIKDYSCLGKQRYLALEYQNSLKNSDLHYFSNVYSLTIKWCKLISDISMLKNNVILVLHLSASRNPTLFGVNYHHVEFQSSDSPKIEQVIVEGKIHHLKVELNTIVRNEENVNLITRYDQDDL